MGDCFSGGLYTLVTYKKLYIKILLHFHPIWLQVVGTMDVPSKMYVDLKQPSD